MWAVAAELARAEEKLIQDSGGDLRRVDWVGLFSEPRGKLQGYWSARLQEHRKETLLQGLQDLDEQVDLRMAGGPGAGGFLEPPVPFEDEVPRPMPDQHFQVALWDQGGFVCGPSNHRKYCCKQGR